MSARIVTLVLPFAPDEQEAHDNAIAAAWALARAAGMDGMDVLQLVPAAGAAPARAADPRVRWWEVANPGATADASAQLIAELAQQALASEGLRDAHARLVLLPAAPLSEEAAALLAATLGGTTFGRCSALALEGDAVAARRLAFGGRLAVDLRGDTPICCATWRAEAGTAALHPLPADAVRRLHFDSMPPPAPEPELLASADRQARLEGARLVVSGGRGIGGPEGFELLAQLAQRLGGALGGSLPAVDAGWVPVARQVGVSGKFVAPRLYFAVGISGTPQHLAGIATTTRIVALNKDRDAPIFGVADVGVVADWRELLPLVARQLDAA